MLKLANIYPFFQHNCNVMVLILGTPLISLLNIFGNHVNVKLLHNLILLKARLHDFLSFNSGTSVGSFVLDCFKIVLFNSRLR